MIMEITLLIMEKSWNFVLEFLWEPWTGIFTMITRDMFFQKNYTSNVHASLQIYGRPGTLSHDLKIWPITFQGSGPSGPIFFSCEKISL